MYVYVYSYHYIFIYVHVVFVSYLCFYAVIWFNQSIAPQYNQASPVNMPNFNRGYVRPPKNAMEERPFCTAVKQLAVVNGSLRMSKTNRRLMKWFQKFAAPRCKFVAVGFLDSEVTWLRPKTSQGGLVRVVPKITWHFPKITCDSPRKTSKSKQKPKGTFKLEKKGKYILRMHRFFSQG